MRSLKFLLFNVFLLFIIYGFSQDQGEKSFKLDDIKLNSGKFSFNEETLDYGTILQNSDGHREFKFTNIGNKPIIIYSVKGSCGCTVATKPEYPIMPGKSEIIKVKYATNRLGKFKKSITITSNNAISKKVVYIKGNVVKSKTEL